MKYLQNILVTIDFSESTDFVIDQSINIAEKFNSEITLMHVITNDHLNSKLDHFIEESVHAKFEKLIPQFTQKGIHIKDSIITHGVPFEQIINEASTNDYNVIIAGKSSKTDSASYGPGTTIDKLIRKNEVPIWVVRPEPIKPLQHILCPVDFSEASERALGNAITLSRRFGAELIILHIYTPVNYSSIWYEADNAQENSTLRAKQENEFNEFLTQFDFSDVTFKKLTLEGEVHVKILDYINQHKVDLLLIGTTGRTGLNRILMGSIATKVTRIAPCNFVTTKNKDITDDLFESSLKGLESVLNAGHKFLEEKEYQKAIEKFTIALKQHPYNIPTVMGLIETYEAMGDQTKLEYYKKCAHLIVERIWGKKYVNILKL